MNVRAAATSVFAFILLAMASGLISANVRKFADKHGLDNFLVRWTEKLRWERLRGLWWVWLIFGLTGGIALTPWLPGLIDVAPQPQPVPQRSASEYAPFQWFWEQAFLGGSGGSNTGGKFFFTQFGLPARNTSDHEVEFNEAYIVSGITGDKVDVTISTRADGWIRPKDANPIPAKTSFHVQAIFGGQTGNGIPENDFLKEWREFTFVAYYNGREYRKAFDQEWVDVQEDRQHHDQWNYSRVTKKPPSN
jgi:hypothetical protein